MAINWDNAQTPNLSIIKLNGTSYYIKDADARQKIEDIAGAVSGVMHWIGTTTTELEDGDTTNPITVNGKSITAEQGDVVAYDDSEFAYNGSAWQEFGTTGTLRALAFKDNATGTFTPLGSITQSSFDGDLLTSTGTFTPGGAVSAEFEGETLTSTGTFTPEGDVTISTSAPLSGESANYTPEGAVSATFTGASMTSTGIFTATGTVSKPVVTPTSTNVKEIDTIATVITGIQNAVKATVTEGTEILSLDSLTVNDITTAAAVTTKDTSVLTGVDVAAPTFTGTENQQVSVSGTTTGSITGLGFTGTGTVISATFTGTPGDVEVTGTPDGTIDATFTGTANQPISVTGTPTGSLTVTWAGQETSVTVS